MGSSPMIIVSTVSISGAGGGVVMAVSAGVSSVPSSTAPSCSQAATANAAAIAMTGTILKKRILQASLSRSW